MIALLVEECLDAGIEDVCFVISPGKELIPQYFEKNVALEQELKARGKADRLKELSQYDSVHFHTVYQNEQLGDGHAILQAEDWVKSDAVAVLFGDDYFTGAGTGLQQLIDARAKIESEKNVAMIALENIPRKLTSKYGIVDVEHAHESDPRDGVRSLRCRCVQNHESSLVCLAKFVLAVKRMLGEMMSLK